MIALTKSRPQGHRPGYCQELPAAKQSAEAARRLVETALSVWHLECLSDAGTLVASELVTNAITHTDSYRIHIAVRRTGERSVLIGVTDTTPMPPVPAAPADTLSTNSRGLLLVDALTERWGTELYRSGKQVWAELISEAAQ
ncbi:ATP-binding protein [Streptomyces rishiriensis]|uniref:Serine/threonine-protein kinase RsbW n=1 Tax=Streptomyces rishiriensis TaxID=68264 RepID=A0ABU0P348_STRRH|nr:ATP-binding protein [Streptomyces rishiriensis]MDQ0585804.1 serine/threonine-protein kinase RsbW [Streptomyces rishiriensis]